MVFPPDPKDRGLEELRVKAERVIERGGQVHMKFTCEACGSRNTCEEKNQLFTSGRCGECSHVTDLRRRGAGLFAILGGDR